MAPLPVSPLAPEGLPALPPVAGCRFSAVEAGVRYKGRRDVLLAEFVPGTTVAGVLTRNQMPGAPVDWCRAQLPAGRARGLVVNAGNANVFTGAHGRTACNETAAAAARLLGCPPSEIMLASTGVIGEPLPYERIVAALPGAQASLSDNSWADAARAIMTTDTFPKAASRTANIRGVPVRINGIAKGSGMIAPDMATMLSFVVTDAQVPADVLQTLLSRSTARTFNAITVDSDTSTSDTLLLFATGQVPHAAITGAGDPALRDFRAKLQDLLKDLALQVVRDGEGAQKLVEVTVTGAASERAARRIALAIADSPLVKTAIAGEDANWGRIVMAVGKSGQKADRDRLAVDIGGVVVARDGARVEGYDEAPVAAHMKGSEIAITVDVGVGRGRSTVWTCDLTHGYIDINADYRS
ncbi:arginine biosynthesis bifunctional protein ArgJ [Thalassobaculum fulvum]|uniref:Arginine biosynthesis bifunctional protein ArgJ n=1 Tax=Thalassobaculum fulvum TaxID=1633335 RepID=A0A918XQD3_9PROT|nr:bifunctional glutamate N-acetyltransferase/amino-acid acetyltransferase ArgJ [Thalassobaculum fulvum]GHD44020.1 arginine biosynthesis bifunctional protein ArgJ [Thalassobaculum fulvum]